MTLGLKRRGDWLARLSSYLLASRNQPFRLGDHDCALFVSGGIEAMTGIALGGEYRGRYTTYSGGLRLIRRAGFRDHFAFFAAHLPEHHLSEAAPGDVVAIPTPEGPGLGLVHGPAGVYALTRTGCTLLPLAAAGHLLKVG